MNGFLITLLIIIIAEMGDRSQLLCAVLAMRFQNRKHIIAGLVLATILNCALATYLGSTVRDISGMNDEALKLFGAFAYILGGVGMLCWNRPLDMLENWTTTAFTTSFLGIFILQIGDKSQFIIGANAAGTEYPSLVFIASVIAILLASVPAIIFQEKLGTILPLKPIRMIGGIIITIWGIIMAMSAFRLFG